MRLRWMEVRDSKPEARQVIDIGLAKLHKYEDRAFENPMYTVAAGI